MVKKKSSKIKGLDTKTIIIAVVIVLIGLFIWAMVYNKPVSEEEGGLGTILEGFIFFLTGGEETSGEEEEEAEEPETVRLYYKDTDTGPQENLNFPNLTKELNTFSCVKVYIDENCTVSLLDGNGDPIIYKEGDKCQYSSEEIKELDKLTIDNNKIYEYYSIWGSADINKGCVPYGMRRFVGSCPACDKDDEGNDQEPLCVTKDDFICPGTTIKIKAAKCACGPAEKPPCIKSGETKTCIEGNPDHECCDETRMKTKRKEVITQTLTCVNYKCKFI